MPILWLGKNTSTYRAFFPQWFTTLKRRVEELDDKALPGDTCFRGFFFKEYSWHFELQEKEELLGTFYRTGEVQKHLGCTESRHVVFDENYHRNFQFPYNQFDPTALPPKNLYHDPLRCFIILLLKKCSWTHIYYILLQVPGNSHLFPVFELPVL